MEHAPPEDRDDSMVSGDESDDGPDSDDLKQDLTSPSVTAGDNTSSTAKPLAQLQKRRRVTRACDECRRKKIKCDGKQPCTHCTVYSYECTYDQPSNRRRNPAPQYVEHLEHRTNRAEGLLHILIPNLNLNDPGIDAAVSQGWIPGAPGKGTPGSAQERRAQRPPPNTQPGTMNRSDTQIESMVRAVAQLDMDESGNWDYHGHSSGLSFVRRMREQLGDLMGPDTATSPFIKSRAMPPVVESPRSNNVDSPATGDLSSGSDLPPKKQAQAILGNAVDDATSLFRVVHKPSFWASFERLYSTAPENYTNEDQKYLPLFHSALALGHLFGKDEQPGVNREGYEGAIQQGLVHFKIARQLMDIADCRDLMGIQAIVFMIFFLQSSAKMSQCYAYVGVALRSALRMGLHRSFAGNFDPVEAETRKRVFWIVRKLDIYVGAMLGLPQTLSDDDIDQEFPTEVDDEFLTEDGIKPMPDGQLSVMTAFNAHSRLIIILSKIVRYVYPIKVLQKHGGPEDKSYAVPFSSIREIESDLEHWKNSLPPILSPCPAPARYTRVQQLLRLSYSHAQVMLYRPFLHFVAMEKRSNPIDQRAYACAASYVNVSRNIIHITTQMKQKGLLNGSYWFIMYTSFFAILSLVYFAAENPDNVTTEAVMKDAHEGKQVLASLAQRSMAADRCTVTLDVVFQRLPDWMRNGQQNPLMTSRKRQSDSYPAQTPNPAASRSHPDVSSAGSEEPIPGLSQRASTFPQQPGGSKKAPTAGSPAPFDSWSQSGSSSNFGPQTPSSTDFNPSTYMPYGGAQTTNPLGPNMQQYTMPPNNYPNPAIADLSTLMFPAPDEPFGYPNQPLTTFENTNHYPKTSADSPHAQLSTRPPFGSLDTAPPPASSAMPPPSAPRPIDDNMEAQFFALPPYMDQRQQHHGSAGLGFPGDPPRGTNLTSNTPANAQMNMWPGRSQQQQQQQQQQRAHAQHQQRAEMQRRQYSQQSGGGEDDFSNINIQDVFGGLEYKPMFMNGHMG